MLRQNAKKELVLNVRKPIGWTSNDVVRFVKHRFDGKVGHAGTLDPFADGVLLVCLGNATKGVTELMKLEKEYRATIEFGIATDTLDVSGFIQQRDENCALSQAQVEHVLLQFIGTIEQEPPAFSALRVDGKRAYQLAREQQILLLAKRPVVVHGLTLLSFADRRLTLDVRCGKGTYIRSLARDIAGALGTVGYLRALTRTRIGHYRLEDAVSLEQLEKCILNS